MPWGPPASGQAGHMGRSRDEPPPSKDFLARGCVPRQWLAEAITRVRDMFVCLPLSVPVEGGKTELNGSSGGHECF